LTTNDEEIKHVTAEKQQDVKTHRTLVMEKGSKTRAETKKATGTR
jgi:hypothetical protein